jgi:hypothetical protein
MRAQSIKSSHFGCGSRRQSQDFTLRRNETRRRKKRWTRVCIDTIDRSCLIANSRTSTQQRAVQTSKPRALQASE